MFQFVHLTCALVQEIGEQAAHDRLVTDDQHVALSLQLHDNWLQPLNQVLVGLERKEWYISIKTKQKWLQLCLACIKK